MLDRFQKPRPLSPLDRTRSVFPIHRDEHHKGTTPPVQSPDDSRQRSTLAPASLGAMNARSMASGISSASHNSKAPTSVPTTAAHGADHPRRMTSTIRAVQNQDDRGRPSFDDDAPLEWSSSAMHTGSTLSSSLDSNDSAPARRGPHANGGDSRNSMTLRPGNSTGTLGNPETPSRTPSPGNGAAFEVPRRESSLGMTRQAGRFSPGNNASNGAARTSAPDEGNDGVGLSATEAQLSNGWDSTVGKAALSGKTGRVINRLVSDNEVLKRDIKIEKLKAEEFRQQARLVEDKMERTMAEYESRLLEANVTKALLSRKERQVESLQAAVELEKQRTSDAREKERTWRDEMDKVRGDSKRQVEQATTQAALMEGRYNAISGHWKEQGDEVNKALARVRGEMATLLEERAVDDDKINTLRELCDQQDGNIRDLLRQNADVTRKFEEYKAEQERALFDIKTKAAEREAEQLRTLEETREVLHKLRWALNVKENLREDK
ncbi:hypothetical protein RB594_005224 [Gaeumannomyces avenae]